MNYFKDAHTPQEIKKLYRRLAMENHPDHGGNTRVMQDINAQYLQALKAIDGYSFEGSDNETHRYTYDQAKEQKIIEIVDHLLTLELRSEIEIYIIGLWIWILNTTREDKALHNELKALDFRYLGHRKSWAYNGTGYRSYRSSGNLDDLATQYGAERVTKAANKHSARLPV